MNIKEHERMLITKRSERGDIEADQFYYALAMTYPTDSERQKRLILKSDWAFERMNGFINLSFSE